MRKTVEVEYVGIEDVQEIMDDAFALMKEGNYANVEVSNYRDGNALVRVHIMIGGFDSEREYDYDYSFYMTDRHDDVDEMNACKSVMKNLLVEE